MSHDLYRVFRLRDAKGTSFWPARVELGDFVLVNNPEDGGKGSTSIFTSSGMVREIGVKKYLPYLTPVSTRTTPEDTKSAITLNSDNPITRILGDELSYLVPPGTQVDFFDEEGDKLADLYWEDNYDEDYDADDWDDDDNTTREEPVLRSGTGKIFGCVVYTAVGPIKIEMEENYWDMYEHDLIINEKQKVKKVVRQEKTVSIKSSLPRKARAPGTPSEKLANLREMIGANGRSGLRNRRRKIR